MFQGSDHYSVSELENAYEDFFFLSLAYPLYGNCYDFWQVTVLSLALIVFGHDDNVSVN